MTDNEERVNIQTDEIQNNSEIKEEEISQVSEAIQNKEHQTLIFSTTENTENPLLTINISTEEKWRRQGEGFMKLVQKQTNWPEAEKQLLDKNAEIVLLTHKLQKAKQLQTQIEQTKNAILANTPAAWQSWINNIFALIAVIAVPLSAFLGVVAEKRRKDQEEMKKNLDEWLARAEQGINQRHKNRRYLED